MFMASYRISYSFQVGYVKILREADGAACCDVTLAQYTLYHCQTYRDEKPSDLASKCIQELCLTLRT